MQPHCLFTADQVLCHRSTILTPGAAHLHVLSLLLLRLHMLAGIFQALSCRALEDVKVALVAYELA